MFLPFLASQIDALQSRKFYSRFEKRGIEEKNMKKIMIALVLLGMLAPLAALAETSGKVQINAIRVQDNRTWITFTPFQDLGCDAGNAVEVANSNPNQKLIISVAMSAMLAGKDVFWVCTPGNCSNVNKNVVKGIKVFP
jgi:predicted PurR-regulated permease PerM